MNRLRPLSIKNVTPHVVSDPRGIDFVVKGLQLQFDTNLDWLDKSFARAVIRTEERENQGEYVFPAMFVQNGYDYLNMLELDNFDSYSFFVARDPETVTDYEEEQRNNYSRRLSCIFWMNLQRVDDSRQDDFLEELKIEIRKSIMAARYDFNSNGGEVLGVEVLAIYDEPKNIFEGFSLNVTDTQFLYYPYRGLRIDLNCSYIENC